MQKAIVSVVGKDRVGIIAALCSELADNNINILDISQTIIDGFFTMMMICDLSHSEKEFDKISGDVEKLSEKLGIQIKIQRTEIFERMQRI